MVKTKKQLKAPKPPPRKRRSKTNRLARVVNILRKPTKRNSRLGPPDRSAPKLKLNSPNYNMNIGTNSKIYLKPGAVREDHHTYDALKFSNSNNEYAMVLPPSRQPIQTIQKGNPGPKNNEKYVGASTVRRVRDGQKIPPPLPPKQSQTSARTFINKSKKNSTTPRFLKMLNKKKSLRQLREQQLVRTRRPNFEPPKKNLQTRK